MMITPIEAMDLMQYLREQSLLTPELWQKCQATIKQYRLGLGVGNGKRSFLRRTYTCPFFAGAEFGCPLPREIKPYGCLAFNSHHPTLKASEHCFSDTALLEELPSASATEFPQLNWEKLSIPEAIIACWEINFADQ